MSIEQEMKLRAEYMNCRDDLKWGMVILLACGFTIIFCAVKGFFVGSFVGMIVQLWTVSRCEKARDRMKEIQWEFDRG